MHSFDTSFVVRNLVSRLVNDLGEAYTKDHSGITGAQLNSILRTGEDLSGIIAIARASHISLDSIIEGSFDYNAAREYISGNKYAIPDKYLTVAHTSLDYHKSIFAQLPKMVRNRVQYDLQITEEFLQNTINGKVNTQVSHDLMEKLSEYGMYSLIESLGTTVSIALRGTPFAKAFKNLSIKETYERLLEEVFICLEKSHIYKITQNNNDIIVLKRWYSEDVDPTVERFKYKNSGICKYIAAFGASIPSMNNEFSLNHKHVKCMHKGDPYCE